MELGELKRIYERKGIQGIKRHLLHEDGQEFTKSVLGRRYFLKLAMYDKLGYWPRIRNPRSFNEKIAHRKLYTDNDMFSVVEDKWRVRDYVTEKIGDEILPELYHVTDDPETIPFDELPQEYVIKPTHMSGPILFAPLRRHNVHLKRRCKQWLETTYGQGMEEYWYDDITPRIIVEERLKDTNQRVPRDFRFHVFHGRAEYLTVDLNRFTDDRKKRFYDRNWNPQDFTKGHPPGPVIEEPEKYHKMLEIADTLGEDFDYVRVDLYCPFDERVVFGEMTVGPASGMTPFEPREYDFKFGSLW